MLWAVDRAKRQFAETAHTLVADLQGLYGDEGPAIRQRLEALEKALATWDRAIQTFEGAVAAQRSDVRYRLTLAGVYFDRHRPQDALRESRAAIDRDPSRPEGHTLLGLIHLSESRLEQAAAAFERAAALEPADPRHFYRLADIYRDTGRGADASAALQSFERTAEARLARVLQQRHAEPAAGTVASGYPDGMSFPNRVGPIDLLAESTASPDRFLPLQYERASALFAEGRYAQAIEALRDAAAQDPLIKRDAAFADRVRLASVALRERGFDAAIGHLAAIVEHYPQATDPRRLLGNAYWAKGDLDNAAAAYRAALAVEPREERVHLALASALLAANRRDEGEAALKTAVTAMPRSGRAWYSLGRFYQSRGRMSDAVDPYREAIRLRPMAGLHTFQGIVASLQADHASETAIEALRALVRVNPNSTPRHLQLGSLLLQKNRFDEALAEYSSIALMDPLSTAAHSAIAQLEFRRGRYQQAIVAARRALDADGDHMQARYTLGQALMRVGNFEQGRKELEEYRTRQEAARANEHRHREVNGLRQEAALRFRNGEYDKAAEFLRQFTDGRSDGQSKAWLGEVLLKAGRYEEAIESFKQAIELNWLSADVHLRMSEAYRALGRVEDSERERAVAERMRAPTPHSGNQP